VFGGTADPAALGLRTETHTPTTKKQKASTPVAVGISVGIAPHFNVILFNSPDDDQDRDPFGMVYVG
jgi:hypothetical protein